MSEQRVTTHDGATVSIDQERKYSTFLRLEQGAVTARFSYAAAQEVYNLLYQHFGATAADIAPCDDARQRIELG